MDGDWEVQRIGGLLPPMSGLVRKRIDGPRGWTTLGPLHLPFDVYEGRRLRYRFPPGLSDELAPDGPDAYTGVAKLFGRPIGTFRMTRFSEARPRPRAKPSSG